MAARVSAAESGDKRDASELVEQAGRLDRQRPELHPVYYDRMRELGIGVGSAMGTLLELYPDLSTPVGRRAEAVVHTQAQALAAVLT